MSFYGDGSMLCKVWRTYRVSTRLLVNCLLSLAPWLCSWTFPHANASVFRSVRQAPSYKVGQRLWEQTRADAAAAARARGEEFSLQAFHTRALNLGSVPLDVLRSQLGR